MGKLKLSNWRSTVAGLAMILSAVSRMHSASDLGHADIYGQIAGGIGLILCADASRKGTDNHGNSTPEP